MPLLPSKAAAAIVKPVEDEQSRLVARIKANLKKGVETYQQIGQDLIRAKELYGQHKKWGPWLKANLPTISRARVTQCMKLAKELEKLLVTSKPAWDTLTEAEQEQQKDRLWRRIQGNVPKKKPTTATVSPWSPCDPPSVASAPQQTASAKGACTPPPTRGKAAPKQVEPLDDCTVNGTGSNHEQAEEEEEAEAGDDGFTVLLDQWMQPFLTWLQAVESFGGLQAYLELSHYAASSREEKQAVVATLRMIRNLATELLEQLPDEAWDQRN